MLEPNGETVPWPTVELNKDGVELKLGVLDDPKRDGDEPAENAGVVDDWKRLEDVEGPKEVVLNEGVDV